MTSVREFLETYDLYERFGPPNAAGFKGEWPAIVDVLCSTCGDKRSHRMWPTRLAGFALEWGVYMIHGTCERCGTNGAMFWVEVNQQEGWMRKAGQLPAAAALAHAGPGVP